ncbi:conserved hypothetical protein [Delftia phage PhiW-14]|uniref:Uncharacterized protein n=1 Tax=Delftia phage PhiW-14 TaxID=665032 RepID=C9DFX7_BPW14|nr:tail protein [Delftia phage PhiW-14]ACV50028.1 conserved hypothetical protein [Delftia phage PhiW-14]
MSSVEQAPADESLYNPLEQMEINSILLYREGWTNEEKFDIKEMMYELDFYEDIHDIMSAKIVLMDYANITDNFPVVGGERLDIRYKTPTLDQERSAKYIIAKITSKELSQDGQNLSVLVLDLVTPERWVDANMTLSKSYKGTYGEIVAKILDNFTDPDRPDLPNPKPFVMDETLYVQKFIAPNWSPIKCVLEISRRTMGEDHEPFYFFETLDGFNFFSIKNMLHGESVASYRIEPGGVSQDAGDFNRKFNRVLKYEIKPYHDRMRQFAEHGYGSRYVFLDPTTQRFKLSQSADYRTMASNKQFFKVEEYPLVDPYVYGRDVYGDVLMVREDKSHEGHYYRQMNASLIDDQRVIIAVPGNSSLRAGVVVELEIPDRSISGYRTEQVSSGRWLVCSLKQVITRESFTTVLELVKNGYAVDINEKMNKEPVYDKSRAEQAVSKPSDTKPEIAAE